VFVRSSWKISAVAAVALLASVPHGNAACSGERRFDWQRDRLAFANDTLWAYGVDAQGRQTRHAKAKLPEYTRHCFVMCRAVLQFYKFARFDATRPKLPAAEYRALVRRISRIPVWLPCAEKITIPGYADLRSFSAEHTGMFEDELGLWWPSYLRVGNWRMAMPFPRIFQRRLAAELAERIDRGELQALFMTRFKPLNHCVVAYGCERRARGDIRFWTYDPNRGSGPQPLDFKSDESSFYCGKSDYFKGGRVNLFKAYISPWQ
jgi:hypothetical protein